MKDATCGGPYLAAAFFCETVLKENTGVFSAIRILDRVTLQAGRDAPEAMPTTLLTLNAMITFKSGQARGKHTIGIAVEKPSGSEKLALAKLPVLFEGNDRGHQWIVNLRFNVDQEGLYWFDVSVDDRLVTRMPLRVIYQRLG